MRRLFEPGRLSVSSLAGGPGRAGPLAAFLVAWALAGCGREPAARVVSAEYVPGYAAGQPGSTGRPEIHLFLDRPLPEGLDTDAVKVASVPESSRWSGRVRVAPAGGDRRLLVVEIRSGEPRFQLEGRYGTDPGATGLRVDLGDGSGPQTIDLQKKRLVPVLERAIWQDSSANSVVDEGDRLRLLFDLPVELPEGGAAEPVRAPGDILLGRDRLDRLDDGRTPARFEPGSPDLDREVRIRLGSRPLLSVAGPSLEPGGGEESSVLAVNGTAIHPMPRVSSRGGGPGVASHELVPLELGEEQILPHPRPRDRLPPPGGRMGHTLTPWHNNTALVAGGLRADTHTPLDDVLVYNPLLAEFGQEPFIRLDTHLPRGTYDHTATWLPGGDGLPGTHDDLVVIAGGTDGTETFGTVTVIRSPEKGLVVQPITAGGLRVPRASHSAVAIGPLSLLVDGGRRVEGGLVGCAEVLELAPRGDEIVLAGHRTFRSLARMHHTLTLLAPDAAGRAWVLAYGGYGRNRQLHPQEPGTFGEPLDAGAGADCTFSYDAGSILVSPVLISPESPRESVADLEYESSLPLLRSRHSATPLETRPAGGLQAALSAVILGGTLRHAIRGFDGTLGRDWEIKEWIPGRGFTEADPETLRRLSQQVDKGKETHAAYPVLFFWDPAEPRASHLEVVPLSDEEIAFRPPPNRLEFAACRVPGLGVVLTGGESPSSGDQREISAAIEIFLERDHRWVTSAVRLSAPRSRHQTFLVETEGKRSLLLVGGITTSGAGARSFAPVEEVPLPRVSAVQ